MFLQRKSLLAPYHLELFNTQLFKVFPHRLELAIIDGKYEQTIKNREFFQIQEKNFYHLYFKDEKKYK